MNDRHILFTTSSNINAQPKVRDFVWSVGGGGYHNNQIICLKFRAYMLSPEVF